MGWGVGFNTEIYLNKQNYKSIYELEDAIKEEELSLQQSKERLLMLVSCNPQDLVKPDEFVLWELHNSFNDIWTEVLELNTKIYNLYLYLEYAKEHGIINPFADEK